MKRLLLLALSLISTTNAEPFRIISITPYPSFPGIYRLQFMATSNSIYTLQRATNFLPDKAALDWKDFSTFSLEQGETNQMHYWPIYNTNLSITHPVFYRIQRTRH